MRRESFRQVSYWTLIVGALGGVAAVLSGLQAEENISHGDAVHRVMETHELLAFVTLGIFGVLAAWRVWRERRMGTAERAVALAATLAGAGVLIATSVYGGRLVFDHAAGIPTEVLTAESRERTVGHEHAPGEGHGDADSAAAGAHVDPPGAPPHGHDEPATTTDTGHSHAPGAPAHEH
jgi:uncharacterized membrane protein